MSSTEKNKASFGERAKRKIIYTVDETPPWHLCLLLGFQNYLTQFGSTLMVPLLVADVICAGHDAMVKNYLISSTLIVCGLATFLQCSVGVRLPMMLGANFMYVIPVYNMMRMPEWQCDPVTTVNGTNGTELQYDSRWTERLREISGAALVASAVQISAGLFGVVGYISSRVGPIVFAAVILSLGLSIISPAINMCSQFWPISILTIVMVCVFWMYFARLQVPLLGCSYHKSSCKFQVIRFPLFSSFPIFLAMLISWVLCWILTVTNVFSSDPKGFGYKARTDLSSQAIAESAWIRIPYPFQWGFPTVTTTVSIGMIVGMIGIMTDSVSDYYTTARAAGAVVPPSSAVNRGIFIEGLMTVVAGLLGSGAGTATYTENVAVIAITRVGSARVGQVAGLISIFLAIFGKFASVLATIPDPVAGGVLLILFGVIMSLGLQNLQYVDLTSMRNIFAVGVPVHIGFASLYYFTVSKPGQISTGIDIVDQLMSTILGNNVVLACLLSLFFDSTLPGTIEERGLLKWRQNVVGSTDDILALDDQSRTAGAGEAQNGASQQGNILQVEPVEQVEQVEQTEQVDKVDKVDTVDVKVEKERRARSSYDLPCMMGFLERYKVFSKIPISPTYKVKQPKPKQPHSKSVSTSDKATEVQESVDKTLLYNV